MKFGFIAKHRGIWPAESLCGALGVSRGGFYAWVKRPRSRRSRTDEELGARVRASFLASDRTYAARRVWYDMLAEGLHPGGIPALPDAVTREAYSHEVSSAGYGRAVARLTTLRFIHTLSYGRHAPT